MPMVAYVPTDMYAFAGCMNPCMHLPRSSRLDIINVSAAEDSGMDSQPVPVGLKIRLLLAGRFLAGFQRVDDWIIQTRS